MYVAEFFTAFLQHQNGAFKSQPALKEPGFVDAIVVTPATGTRLNFVARQLHAIGRAIFAPVRPV
jgi:hypothetical protein